MANLFEIKAGSSRPPLRFTVLDPNTNFASAMDLTGVESVECWVQNNDGGAYIVEGAAAEIEDAANGKIKYEWSLTDLASIAVDTTATAEFVLSFGYDYDYGLLTVPYRSKDELVVRIYAKVNNKA